VCVGGCVGCALPATLLVLTLWAALVVLPAAVAVGAQSPALSPACLRGTRAATAFASHAADIPLPLQQLTAAAGKVVGLVGDGRHIPTCEQTTIAGSRSMIPENWLHWRVQHTDCADQCVKRVHKRPNHTQAVHSANCCTFAAPRAPPIISVAPALVLAWGPGP
jgi:hypothetical protein